MSLFILLEGSIFHTHAINYTVNFSMPGQLDSIVNIAIHRHESGPEPHHAKCCTHRI